MSKFKIEIGDSFFAAVTYDGGKEGKLLVEKINGAGVYRRLDNPPSLLIDRCLEYFETLNIDRPDVIEDLRIFLNKK